MQIIEIAWRNWLLQFAPHIFSAADLIQDPNEELFPRITYSAGITEALNNGQVTLILWDKSFNDSRIFEMHSKIDKAVPALVGTELIIKSESRLEYLHPDTGAWIEFQLIQFQEIADWHAARTPPLTVNWREVKGGAEQRISIWRDTTYSQPYPQDEPLIRARYIRLHVRNRTLF